MKSLNDKKIGLFGMQTEEPFQEEEKKCLSKDEHFKEKETTVLRENIFGSCLMLFASTIFTINGILVQHFKLDSVDTVFVRSILQISFLGILIKLKGNNKQYSIEN